MGGVWFCMTVGGGPLGLDDVASLLESAERPLPRREANRLAKQVLRALDVDAGGMISLMLCLQGDFRHAGLLAERLLPADATWAIDPEPGTRAAVYTVRLGSLEASGLVPALVLAAALLRCVRQA